MQSEHGSSVHESKPERGSFSPEVVRRLKQEGYQIFTLDGDSLRILQEKRKISSSYAADYFNINDGHSELRQIAILPNQLFLPVLPVKEVYKPGSFPHIPRKTFQQQEKDVEEYSRRFSKTIGGTKAIIGQISDYAAIASLYLEESENYIFDAFLYVQDRSPKGDNLLAFVGRHMAGIGVSVYQWDAHLDGNRQPKVAPLIIPA
ncbi:MAG: hypothetical protein HYW62_04590 [Candidatus Levybacteria bacterium]|nr:hypothetical protein [Candidatus Levybacteria bacterium]